MSRRTSRVPRCTSCTTGMPSSFSSFAAAVNTSTFCFIGKMSRPVWEFTIDGAQLGGPAVLLLEAARMGGAVGPDGILLGHEHQPRALEQGAQLPALLRLGRDAGLRAVEPGVLYPSHLLGCGKALHAPERTDPE